LSFWGGWISDGVDIFQYVLCASVFHMGLFAVQSGEECNVGYSFFNPAPIGEGSFLMGIQYLGFRVFAIWTSVGN